MSESGSSVAGAIFVEEIIPGNIKLYRPFSSSISCPVEILKPDENTDDKDIIEERGGIHYINQSLLGRKGGDGKEINQDFKKLVDSIIG